jgi:hypothetical protein
VGKSPWTMGPMETSSSVGTKPLGDGGGAKKH